MPLTSIALIEYETLSPRWQPYRPNNTYNDNEIPKPPLRLRSSDQEEKDRIFGYPPVLGSRNLPQGVTTPFNSENIDLQLGRIRVREAARDRGIQFEPWLPTDQIQVLINQHDENQNNPVPQGLKQRKGKKKTAPKPAASAPATPGPSRKKRRAEPAEDATVSDAPQGEGKKKEAGGGEKAEVKKRQNEAAPPAQENVAPVKAPRLRLIFRES